MKIVSSPVVTSAALCTVLMLSGCNAWKAWHGTAPKRGGMAGSRAVCRSITQTHSAERRAEGLRTLAGHLQSGNPSTVKCALNTFNYIRNVEFDRTAFQPALLKACNHDEVRVRRVAYSTYLHTAIKHKWSEAEQVEMAFKGLNDPDPWINKSVIGSFWGYQVSRELEDRLIEESYGEHKGYIIYHFLSTRPRVSRQVAERLVEILSERPEVNGRAAWGINHKLTKGAATTVSAFCRKTIEEDDRPGAITFAFSQLSRLQDRSMTAQATRLESTSTNDAVKEAAAKYIEEMGDEQSKKRKIKSRPI